jgi:Ran GTPase-activating protein (RanGAP) involved in mRNA processing and transport
MTLGDFLPKLPLLQHLDVSESGITPDAAVSLSKGLKSHSSLQVFRIAYNNIQTRGFSAIATCLSAVKTLKLLDARGNGIHLSLAQEVVSALGQSSLRELLLQGNCTPVGSQAPQFQRSGMVRHTITFRPSDFRSHADIDFEPMEAEDRSEGPAFVLQAFLWSSLPKYLKRLHLADCQITDSQITTLVRALETHEVIEILDLHENQISSPGARAIFSWLKRNRSLRELLLGNNYISDSSSTDLIEALGVHPCLEKVSLKGNYSFGEENLRPVIQAAVLQGDTLLLTQKKRFTLDLSATDVSFTTRARIKRETADLTQIYLFI